MFTFLAYGWLPAWMGVETTGDFIGAIFVTVLLLFLYMLIGAGVCPNSFENHLVRALTILFWPVFLVLCFISMPFIILLEFSRTPEEQDKDYRDWYNSMK